MTAAAAIDYRALPAPHPGAGRSNELSARIRKLIGMVAILGFLFAYVVAAITVADMVPQNLALQLVYFAVVGTCWFIPIVPLVKWMNRGR